MNIADKLDEFTLRQGIVSAEWCVLLDEVEKLQEQNDKLKDMIQAKNIEESFLRSEIMSLEQQLESCQNKLLGVAEQLDIAEAVLSVQVTASALAYFKGKQDEEK